MKLRSLAGNFVSGALLANSLPHFVVAATGRKNMTPFGQDSSPAVNALWATMNVLGGLLLARFSKEESDSGSWGAWSAPFAAGGLLCMLFGLLFTLNESRKKDSDERD